MAETKPQIVIVGAGIGGLFLAQFLRKQGISFQIFDRDASPTARTSGWAIGFSMQDDYAAHMSEDVPSLRSTCHLLPLDLPSQFVFYPPGSKGGQGPRFGTEDTVETPCVRANRFQLRQMLLTGLDVQWGKQAVRVEENPEKKQATVFFADGTSVAGDLVVGADGTWSKVRESVLGKPNTESLDAVPMAMISGETTLRGAALEQQLRLGYSSYIAIHPPDDTFFCGLDRVSESAEEASFYWFLYMRDDTAAAADHWLRSASREEKYQRVLDRTAAVDSTLTQIVREGGVDAISDDFTLYYDAILKTLPSGRRTLLIGDAAHPTTPFRGEGGITAIQDVLRLSKVLSETDFNDATSFQTAIDALQQDILDRGAAVVQLSRDAVFKRGPPPKDGPPPKTPMSWGYPVRPIPPSTRPLGVHVGEGSDKA